MTTDPDDRHDDYVNGRAAAEVQKDRARDHASPDVDGPTEPGSEQPRSWRPAQRLGRWLRRLTGRSRTVGRTAVPAVLVCLLVLTACGSSGEDAASEQTGEQTADQPTEQSGAQTEEQATVADEDPSPEGPPVGTAVCTDPTDDGVVVDSEANESYEGDAYTADTVELRLEATADELRIRTQENSEKIDEEPAGPLRFDIWLASPDGSETGLVRVTAPGPADITVEAGTGPDSLETVEGGSPRFGGAGSFLTSLDRDLLPVLDQPFGFAFVETMEGNGTADICPNEASIDDPLADVDALADFPG